MSIEIFIENRPIKPRKIPVTPAAKRAPNQIIKGAIHA
jgi:hypothetical protein